jgi:hypothetical protein
MVICGYDEKGELVAIAPLKVNSKKRPFDKRPYNVLEFIGWGERVTPEYLDVIIQAGLEQMVLPRLIDYLLSRGGIDALELKPFNPDSGNLGIIESHLRAKTGTVWLYEHSRCPVAALAADWSQYLSSKSKNFRKKMKEFERICRRDMDFKIELCEKSDDIEIFFGMLTRLHQMRWSGKSESFLSPKYLDFHRAVIRRLLENNWLRLMIAFDGATPIAAIYCFFYGGTYYYYQSGRDIGYDRFRLGLVLINATFQRAIAEGARTFDFLTGSEPYKFRWADGVRSNYSLNYYRRKKDYWAVKLPWVLRLLARRVLNRLRKSGLGPYLFGHLG